MIGWCASRPCAGVWLTGLEFAKEKQLRGVRIESDIEVYEWVEILRNVTSTKICDTMGANDQTSGAPWPMPR